MHTKRFFVPQPLGGTTPEAFKDVVTLSSESLVNQLRNVFRLGIGDHVTLFDNSGYDYLVNIDSLEKNRVTFKILETKENTVRLAKEIYLFASLVKKDNFEWISQKATELGVSYIVPIISSRSEKKNLNFERLEKIIIEASEQSGRGHVPVLKEIISIDEAVKNYKNINSIVWHTNAEKFTSQNLKDVCGMYIGPEGGWSDEEIDLFNKNEIPVYSLGPQILRAETAVISALSQIVF